MNVCNIEITRWGFNSIILLLINLRVWINIIQEMYDGITNIGGGGYEYHDKANTDEKNHIIVLF